MYACMYVCMYALSLSLSHTHTHSLTQTHRSPFLPPPPLSRRQLLCFCQNIIGIDKEAREEGVCGGKVAGGGKAGGGGLGLENIRRIALLVMDLQTQKRALEEQVLHRGERGDGRGGREEGDVSRD
jgi:hypothetical protein